MAEVAAAGRAGRMLMLLAAALALLAACGRAPAPVVFHAEGLPEKLSDWRLFDLRDGQLAPNQGVEAYELNTPLFSDYAHKLRTVWMPAGSVAAYDARETLDFPVGTILSKTFYYPRLAGEPAGIGRVQRSEDAAGPMPGGRLALAQVRLLETRLLVRREQGWIALPYVWDEAQGDARLMRSGSLVPLALVDAEGSGEAATYAVPDQNQCAACHVSDVRSRKLGPLGPTARNLNRDIQWLAEDGSLASGNQLARWQRAGRLAGAPGAAQLPRLANWRDTATASLDARARAYLEVNCGHCHSPDGPGNTSGLWLGSEVSDPLRLGRCKLPIAAGQGTGDRRYGIVPGDPDASILAYRMDSNDPGVMMPELGRSVVHDEGVALVRAWIAAQDGSCGADAPTPGQSPAHHENNEPSEQGTTP